MKIKHKHQDKVLRERVSTGKNLLGERKTALVQDLICEICGNKHLIILHN